MLKALAIGHLGKDAVVNLVNGKNVINFSVAHSEKWKDAQGQPMEKTTWVDCSYWTDKTAVAPYLKKGTQVYVEGQPEVRTYQANDGTTKATLSVRVGSIQLLSSASNDNSQGQAREPYARQAAPASVYNQPKPMPQYASAAQGAPEYDLPF
jgi:single-strand DNA-binding protein